MRVSDWPQRFDALIEAARAREFAYGSFDCLLFAGGDVVEALTGVDPAAAYRGTYDSLEGAQAILAKFGGLEQILTAHFGDAVHPSAAMRGDIVLADLKTPGGAVAPCAGACAGLRCAFPDVRGLFFTPRAIARLAWNIR